MDVLSILNGLSKSLKIAINEPFVYVLKNSKVQHFPIREWSKQQVLNQLHQLLSESFESLTWSNYLVCFNQETKIIVILPRYHDFSELIST